MSNKENIPEEFAKIVLGKAGRGDRFWIQLFGFKIPFQIRPITGQGEVEIGEERSRLTMDNISEETDMFIGMMENYKNVIVFSKMIAIAALYSGWKKFLFKRTVARMIRKGTNEDIAKLMAIIRKQSNAERFFFTMTLALEFSQLLTKKPKAETPGQEK